MTIDLRSLTGIYGLLPFLIALTALLCDGTNTTTTTETSRQFMVPPRGDSGNTSSPKPLQPWLIAVIVLSSIVVMGASVTIVQRCRKRGDDSDNRYTIGDYEP